MTFYISKEVLCDVRFILPRHSLGQMFRLSHRYSSNQTYIRIFTIGHFEVLRLYGSNCQWAQYPFWNFTHFKFSLFEKRSKNWILLFWKFNKIRIIIRPNDRFRNQWSIPPKSSSIFWRIKFLKNYSWIKAVYYAVIENPAHFDDKFDGEMDTWLVYV